MSVELITYGADRRMVLANAEVIRAPIYLANWNTIRIGLRGAFANVSGNITGTPRVAFGVCNGNTNGYGAALSDHVVGFRSALATVTYTASAPKRVDAFGGGTVFKKVDAAITVGAASGSNGFFSADTALRSYVVLEISKGSPNFTLTVSSPHTGGEISTDVTDSLFSQYMESAAITPTGGYVTTGPSAMAVSEATDGDLDHIFVYWDRTVQTFGFDIKHRKIS